MIQRRYIHQADRKFIFGCSSSKRYSESCEGMGLRDDDYQWSKLRRVRSRNPFLETLCPKHGSKRRKLTSNIDSFRWLTLEPFITPAIFEPFLNSTSPTPAVDEYTLSQNLLHQGGEAHLLQVLENHYETFIVSFPPAHSCYLFPSISTRINDR
jgi:hypothetical protein